MGDGRRVGEAKAIAARWVGEAAGEIPGFAGAFFHGSVNWLSDDAVLPATSDLDVMVVLDQDKLPPKPGKFRYRDVLLEVSFLARDALRSPEQVLGQYQLAGSFHVPSVILDPRGELRPLQQAVARDYAALSWVERRCEQVRERILHGFPLDAGAAFHEQVMAWLFATGVTTHLFLVAGLRNPTVRQRYLAARSLLGDYGYSVTYACLLGLLGCRQMTRARAAQHLQALAAAFDAATTVIATPVFFAADISVDGRAVAIDGSQELIAGGDQREAIFWMVATAARCQQVFQTDAPHLQAQFAPAFRELVADLGIVSIGDMRERREAVERALPHLWREAQAIIGANPAITL